jgi:hypothetical protein
MINYNYGGLSYKEKMIRFKNVADKIQKEKGKLEKLEWVTWEDFTTDFMKLDMPTTEWQIVSWKIARPIWVKNLNKFLARSQAGALLIIERGKGVKIFTGKAGMSQGAIRSMKKVTSISGRHHEYLEDLKGNFPTFHRPILALQYAIDDSMHAFLGRIEADRALTKADKAALSKVVKSNIRMWLPTT